MAIVPQALTTLAAVKQFLGITTATDDALLEALIDNVTELIEGFMGGRRIKEAVYIDELHDGGDFDIFLDNWPIKAAPALAAEFRTGTIANPTFQLFTENDFEVYNLSGFVHFFGRTPGKTLRGDGLVTGGTRNLRFNYTAGFATIPLDIELVAKQLVAGIFTKRNSQGVKKESVEGTSIEYFTDDQVSALLTDEQRAVIDRYTRQSFGQNL